MIYLDNTTDAQTVLLPVSLTAVDIAGLDLTFSARSTVNLDTPVSATVLDLHTHVLYYDVSLALPEGIQPGEYEYSLKAGNVELSSGVMVVRGGGASVSQYASAPTYKQYNQNQ